MDRIDTTGSEIAEYPANISAITRLLGDYAGGRLKPSTQVARTLERIHTFARPEVWIRRVPDAALLAQAAELDAILAREGSAVFERLPLFGVPFAVKDNIDVAGMPTTAACPDFAYTPERSAFAVQRLLEAGAVLIGKTNLDQFATGLVGTRSPYGAVRHVTDPTRISGGSSSGSAVAVAGGCVLFSLGTDTAGSGRVPAGLNGVVGLKPSLGLVSKHGVVPACRTLDTISVFSTDVADAWRVLTHIAGYDEADSYSRAMPAHGVPHRAPRLGVPEQPVTEDDEFGREAFAVALATIEAGLAVATTPLDFTALQQAGALLYDGPWVAERRAAIGEFFDTRRDAIDPVVAAVVAQADRFTAADAFRAQYRLADLRRDACGIFAEVDVLIVPTATMHPTFVALQADPLGLNARLGIYTNFVNLLDLCALSVPCAPRADGLPFGVTLIAPSGADRWLAELGCRIEALCRSEVLSSTVSPVSPLPSLPPLPAAEPIVTLAVVGAHLRGQPLNWQLSQAAARFAGAVRTSRDYRLYALADTVPPKPGLARVAEGSGAEIELELWDVPVRLFGQFVADIPAPLGIGTITLADGRTVKGFICEPFAVADSRAEDITVFGGWRAYRRWRCTTATDC